MFKLSIILFFFTLLSANAKNGWLELNTKTNTFLNNIMFVDEFNGWAVGDKGLILHTSDAGLNWEVQEANVGSWLLDVHFIDRLNGWVVGDFGTIRHTINGGTSWKIQYSGVDSNWLNSVFFVNENIGWAVGPHGIIHTTNAGESWQSQNSGTYTASKCIFFINETVGWAVGANGIIIRTVDAGENWEVQNSGNSGTIYDIFFIDMSNGWAVGRYEPKLLRTTNGGNDWISQDNPIQGFFKNIQFINKVTGWAAGPGGIIMTSNGGRTWKTQIPDSKYNIWGMHFIDKNYGWVAGGDGKILHTTNGGFKFKVNFKASVTSGNAPLSTTFTDLTDGEPSDWFWDFGDGGTHTTQNPVYIYQEPGKYSVKLSVSDGIDGDLKTKVNYIFVRSVDDIEAGFFADTTIGEAPLTIKFTDLSKGNPIEWFWDFGDGSTHTAQSPIHIYQNSGSYTVSLTVSKDNNNDKKTKINYIHVKNPSNVYEIINSDLLTISMISPNPCINSCLINYNLKTRGLVTLKIYDSFANEIISLIKEYQIAGKYEIEWNLRDSFKKSIAAGNYFFVLTANTAFGNDVKIQNFIYIK